MLIAPPTAINSNCPLAPQCSTAAQITSMARAEQPMRFDYACSSQSVQHPAHWRPSIQAHDLPTKSPQHLAPVLHKHPQYFRSTAAALPPGVSNSIDSVVLASCQLQLQYRQLRDKRPWVARHANALFFAYPLAELLK